MPDSRALVQQSVDKYSKVSLGRFDDGDEVEFLNSAPETPSFGSGVVAILQKHGVPKKYLKNINVGSEDWLTTFKGFADATTDWLSDSVVGGLVGAVFGPEFIPMAESALGSLRSSWRDYVQEGRMIKAAGLEKGMWILINNGVAPPHKDKRRRMIWEELGRAFSMDGFGMGVDPAVEKRFIDEPPEYIISEGFIIGAGDKPNHVRVFNFETFREDDLDLDEISGMSKTRETALDNNPILTSIRDLKFEPPPSDIMDSNVPTDPGTEVVLDGFLYNIVRCEGDLALIEDVHGQRKSVSINLLTAGRHRHTNSYNYRKGRPFMGTWNQKPRVYAGQWVWVTARMSLQEAGVTTHELAVVWKLDSYYAHVVLGIDGTVKVVDQVWPFSHQLEETVELDKEFMEFKRRALEGRDTEGKNLGADHLRFCVGDTYETMASFPTPLTKAVRVSTKQPLDEETVGEGHQDALAEDARQEVHKVTGIPLSAISSPEQGPAPVLAGEYNGGDSLMVYAVLAGLALFAFNSVDINVDILA